MTCSVAIDGVGAKEGGGPAVLQSLTAELLNQQHVSKVIVFCSPRNTRSFELEAGPRLKVVDVPMAEHGPISRLRWLLSGLDRECKIERADVIVTLSGMGLSASCPVVTLIQQALPFSPEALQRLGMSERIRFQAIGRIMAYSAARAASVVVQTEVMRETAMKRFRIPAERISVFTPAPDDVQATKAAPELMSMARVPRNLRLLFVGRDDPHKNLELLEAGLRIVRTRHPGATVFATIRQGDERRTRNGIFPLGHLAPAVIREALSLCHCLVFPSLIETVGLPILESFVAGLPVAVSDRPFAREICGDGAMYFDPVSPDSMAASVQQLMSDEDLRARVRAAAFARIQAIAASKPYESMATLIANVGSGKPSTTHLQSTAHL